MTFLSPAPPIPLMDPAWPVRSHKPQFPPAFVDGGDIRNSILGSGCHLAGCRVRNSVLSPNVRVREGADIADSILFEDVEVGPGARLRKVIIDKHAVIPAGFEIGYEDVRDAGSFKISREGVRVVPKKWNPA